MTVRHEVKDSESITVEESSSATLTEDVVRTARSLRTTPSVPEPDPAPMEPAVPSVNLPLHMHLGQKNVVLPWCHYLHESSVFASSHPSPASLALTPTRRVVPRFPLQLLSSVLLPMVPTVLRSLTDSIRPPGVPSTAAAALPPDLSKVCILGIHGWFPLKFFQKVVGEPTGTSNKFCDQMKSALQAWTKKHYQVSLLNSSITTIPLEHEGKVDVRVEKLYEQITNPHFYVPEGSASSLNEKSYWQTQLESCRTIFVATHSQGCPTSIFLVAKLIENVRLFIGYAMESLKQNGAFPFWGIINPKRQHLVVLSQAGISHGPFPAQRSHLIVKYLEADAARELFDFNLSASDISQRYYEACEKVLDHGGKLVLVSSWLDQVVPLYSSSFYALSHPNIFRAVFIDKDNFAFEDFLSHLVIFALKLRNSGVSDHELLVYLSDVVAGSLYFGSGHSTLYEEASVYELAINFLFTTKHPEDFPLAPLPRSSFSEWLQRNKPKSHFVLQAFDAPSRLNPYHLPWIMHCLVSDPRISSNQALSKDLQRLFELYKDWNVGGSRVRKELKYKLEPFYRASL